MSHVFAKHSIFMFGKLLNKPLVWIHQNILLDIHCSHFQKYSFFISVATPSSVLQNNLFNHVLFWYLLHWRFFFCAWGKSSLFLKYILIMLCLYIFSFKFAIFFCFPLISFLNYNWTNFVEKVGDDTFLETSLVINFVVKILVCMSSFPRYQ